MVANKGRILIADDNPSDLESLAKTLRGESYDCDCAASGAEARELIGRSEYDVLLSEAPLRGDPELGLVRQLADVSPATTVILLAPRPSVECVLTAFGLSVFRYLTQPIEAQQLSANVAEAVRRARVVRSVASTEAAMSRWQDALSSVRMVAGASNDDRRMGLSVSTFVGLNMQQVLAAMTNIAVVAQELSGRQPTRRACQMVSCPHTTMFREAIRDAIAVLERTKSSFKSKDLGALRQQLASVLASADGASA